MAKGKNQKFKLYRLAQIMLEKTDEDHFLTMAEIKEELARYEITAERRVSTMICAIWRFLESRWQESLAEADIVIMWWSVRLRSRN